MVLKGLCGQDFRERAQESCGLLSTPVLLRGGCQASSLPLGFHNQIERPPGVLSLRQPLPLTAPHARPRPRHLHPTCSDTSTPSTSRRGPANALPLPCPHAQRQQALPSGHARSLVHACAEVLPGPEKADDLEMLPAKESRARVPGVHGKGTREGFWTVEVTSDPGPKCRFYLGRSG